MPDDKAKNGEHLRAGKNFPAHPGWVGLPEMPTLSEEAQEYLSFHLYA